jgi:hypothetical protein
MPSPKTTACGGTRDVKKYLHPARALSLLATEFGNFVRALRDDVDMHVAMKFDADTQPGELP